MHFLSLNMEGGGDGTVYHVSIPSEHFNINDLVSQYFNINERLFLSGIYFFCIFYLSLSLFFFYQFHQRAKRVPVARKRHADAARRFPTCLLLSSAAFLSPSACSALSMPFSLSSFSICIFFLMASMAV